MKSEHSGIYVDSDGNLCVQYNDSEFYFIGIISDEDTGEMFIKAELKLQAKKG